MKNVEGHFPDSLVLAPSLVIMQSGNYDEWMLLERKIWTFYLA